MQERRREDAPQAAEVARVDPVVVEIVAVERVDDLDHPHHRDDRQQQLDALALGLSLDQCAPGLHGPNGRGRGPWAFALGRWGLARAPGRPRDRGLTAHRKWVWPVRWSWRGQTHAGPAGLSDVSAPAARSRRSDNVTLGSRPEPRVTLAPILGVIVTLARAAAPSVTLSERWAARRPPPPAAAQATRPSHPPRARPPPPAQATRHAPARRRPPKPPATRPPAAARPSHPPRAARRRPPATAPLNPPSRRPRPSTPQALDRDRQRDLGPLHERVPQDELLGCVGAAAARPEAVDGQLDVGGEVARVAGPAAGDAGDPAAELGARARRAAPRSRRGSPFRATGAPSSPRA